MNVVTRVGYVPSNLTEGGPGLGLGFDGWRGGPGRLQTLTWTI